MNLRIRSMTLLVGLVLSVLTAAPALAAYLDPPNRVARVSYLDGEVSFSAAGEDNWVRAIINRPLIRGDRLWADRRSRVELQLGAAAVRLDQMSSAEILDLDDTYAQFFLAEGSINLYVRRIWDQQVYEIATPTTAVVIRQPGSYRIDVGPDGRYTDVAVWRGGAEAYGEHTHFGLREGEQVRFFNAGARSYQLLGAPRADNFDRFAFDRDRLMENSPSLRYVSDDLIGYTDLDRYGNWSTVREYGAVWFPSRVGSGWAPYRHGHWSWIEPFGWTWVDDAPWGFAVSHYGRWIHVGNRWGWIPSPRHYRAVYAPALVVFVGGSRWSLGYSSSTQPIGWFPLGPRDVWFPAYRVSSGYFSRVNVHNTVINNTTVVNIYNNVYVPGGNLSQVNYRYRQTANAHTVVSQDVFTDGRAVQQGLLSAARGSTAHGEVQRLAPVAPSVRSLTGTAQTTKLTPTREVFQRQVVTHRSPAATVTTAPFRTRQDMLQRQPGVPPPIEPRQVTQASTVTAGRPVRVVGQEGVPVERQQAPERRPQAENAPARTQNAPTRRRPPAAAAQAPTPPSDGTATTGREAPRPAVTPRTSVAEPVRVTPTQIETRDRAAVLPRQTVPQAQIEPRSASPAREVVAAPRQDLRPTPQQSPRVRQAELQRQSVERARQSQQQATREAQQSESESAPERQDEPQRTRRRDYR